MRSVFIAAEAAVVFGASAAGLAADAYTAQAEQPVQPARQEQVQAGPMLSQQSLEELLGRIGIEPVVLLSPDDYVLVSDQQNLCPPPGHPDAGDVVDLGPNGTDPACTNNGLFANPINNGVFCPDGSQAPGAEIPGGMDQYYDATCGNSKNKPVEPKPTQAPIATEPPKTVSLNGKQPTPTSNGSDGGSSDQSSEYGLLGLLGLGAIALGIAVSTTVSRNKKP